MNQSEKEILQARLRWVTLYAEYKKISLSRAILELAQNALEDWEDKKLGDIALKRLSSKDATLLSSNDFWNKANEL